MGDVSARPALSTVQLVGELGAALRRVGIEPTDTAQWPMLRADRNVYGTDIIVLGRIPVDTAVRLLAALQLCPASAA